MCHTAAASSVPPTFLHRLLQLLRQLLLRLRPLPLLPHHSILHVYQPPLQLCPQLALLLVQLALGVQLVLWPGTASTSSSAGVVRLCVQ
jgi:hypothetical protein